MLNFGRKYGLTSTEWEIMEVIWSAEDGLSFQELLDRMNGEYQKDWKRQTLRTFLAGLQKAELVESRGSRKSQIYYPLRSRDEHIHRWTRRLLDKSFDGSLGVFLSAFAGNQPLTPEDIQTIRDALERLSPENFHPKEAE